MDCCIWDDFLDRTDDQTKCVKLFPPSLFTLSFGPRPAPARLLAMWFECFVIPSEGSLVGHGSRKFTHSVWLFEPGRQFNFLLELHNN